MEEFWNVLRENPWIWAVILAGFASWILAVRLIFVSPKFLRKGLWFLLSLFSFGFGWSPRPGVMLSVGLPLGAIYILWFWRFGAAPTDEERSRHEAQLALRPAPTADAGRALVLRGIYMAGAATMLAMGVIGLTGQQMTFMVAHMGMPQAELDAVFPPSVRLAMNLGNFAIAVAGAGFFVFLAFRPYWWGKIACLLPAFAWTMFGLTSWLIGGPDPFEFLILAMGLVFVVIAVTHQIVDPRFGGTYLRARAA